MRDVGDVRVGVMAAGVGTIGEDSADRWGPHGRERGRAARSWAIAGLLGAARAEGRSWAGLASLFLFFLFLLFSVL